MTTEALCQPDRPVVAAVGHEHGLHASLAQGLGGELAILPRADHEHAPRVELPERAARQLDRHRRHRHPRAPDRRLGPGALASGERVAEQAVRDRPGGAFHQRELVRALHLTLDLRLAHNHRLEARRDAEQVPSGVHLARRVERAEQLGGRDARLARQRGQRGALGIHRIARHEVDLGAVAGGDGHGLVDFRVRHEVAQHAGGSPLGQREALTQGQRRGLVRDPEREQPGAHGCRLSARSLRTSSSRSMRWSLAAMIAT